MFDFLFRKKEGEMLPLPFTTDLHCHIVPGVDDGSPDLEHSLRLMERMAAWGIERIVATPHFTDVTFENSPATIDAPFAQLQQAAQEASLGARLIDYSFEYRLGEGFIGKLEADDLRPMPSGHILVENSFLQPLSNLDSLLFDIKLKGMRPILAHPERYAYYHPNRKIYERLRSEEVQLQVNFLSLAGYYGRGVQELVLWMIDKGLVDYMATDLHHQGHVEAIEKYLRSKHYKKLRPKLELLNDCVIP